MKTVFRSATVALAVAGSMLLGSYQPSAQDAEPEIIHRSYDVRPLVQLELWNAPRTGAIGDVLAPDRLFFADSDHELDEWSLRDSGEEARCWENSDDLATTLRYFIEAADDDAEFEVNTTEHGFSVTGNADLQKQFKWAVDALNDVAKARVSMVVYRLKDDAQLASPTIATAEVAGWTNGARHIGNFRGGLAEPFVLQQTQHRSYVGDYDMNVATEAAIANPNVRDLNTGEEFVLGAVSLSDGRLWVQGWHASMKLNRMRSIMSSAGNIEMPDVSYSFAPISAVIENGGAAVIDAGPGARFMVKVDCDRVVKNHEMTLANGSKLRLLNCIGAIRGQRLGGFWLMRPTSEMSLNDSQFPQVFLEDAVDGPYMDAAIHLSEQLDESFFEFRQIGPYLGVIEHDQPDLEAEDARVRDAVRAQLDAIQPAPETVSVRISAFEVADDSALPAGVLDGRPSETDVAELMALAGGKPVFDRVSSNLLRQQADHLQVQLATHLRGYDSQSATGVTALDPGVATLVLGQQIRWQARTADDGKLHIEVRSGSTVGPAEFERVEFGTEGLMIERSLSALTQARLGDELGIGDRMASMTPAVGADGKLIVIVVERLK